MNEEQRKVIIKETFDSVSQGYDCKALRFFSESAKHLASLLPLHGNEHVIDIATGTGNAALTIASRLPKGFVTGVDFSSGMLEQARRKAISQNVQNVKFVEMDMQTMEFDTEKFNMAICAFGIFFVDDMDNQLFNMAKMVNPGGTIAICNFHEDYFLPLRDIMTKRLESYNIQQPPQTWKLIATEAGCKKFFEKAGIQNITVEQKNMGYFLSSAGEWWDLIWNAGYRRILSQLNPSDLERFRKEHMQEVAALATEDGIWLDIGVLFTMGTTLN
jgi:ubiquinone/menaquinone biosynthesis C-methylase UbiE